MRSIHQTPESITAHACVHCGEPIATGAVLANNLAFCCAGCKTVYEILAAHDLCEYYARETTAGVSMKRRNVREDEFTILDDPAVARKILTFASSHLNRVIWPVPSVHCASCVWLLERFERLEPGVLSSTVDIMRKTVMIDFDPRTTSLRRIAERLANIGYAPLLRLSEEEPGTKTSSVRGLYARIGIAGFAAGNTMMMYIAEYFAGPHGIEHSLVTTFRALSIALSIPVLLYSASPWFIAARAALRGRRINLDVPVALGIVVLFARSVFDIVSSTGTGYLDSFNGLVFFLLIGRLFQQRAFDALSFDRTYRSFFPLSVRILKNGNSTVIPIEKINIGDALSVRNGEVVPCDSALESEIGYVDYSFVTGESAPVECTRGEMVYAGGKAMGRAITLIASKKVSHSELAAMWEASSLLKDKENGKRRSRYLQWSDLFGTWFTLAAVGVALLGAAVWVPDWTKSFSIFTAVLIVACPCALTLAAPITLGTAMGLLGRFGIYLKNMGVLLDLERVDSIIFDKTGTLTMPDYRFSFTGRPLTQDEQIAISSVASQSSHPISRAIAGSWSDRENEFEEVKETVGGGIVGRSMGHTVAIGSIEFIREQCWNEMELGRGREIAAAVAIDGEYAGAYMMQPMVRPGIAALIAALRKTKSVALLSGDTDRDRATFEPLFGTAMRFNARPEAKIGAMEQEQSRGHRVLMIGDGLNDAGAMSAADVAIAVTDDTATLVPACDLILRADSLTKLPALVSYAHRVKQLIAVSLTFSILYNALGVTLAIMGMLSPLVAAVLMPLSSLTVIAISVAGARHFARSIAKEGRAT